MRPRAHGRMFWGRYDEAPEMPPPPVTASIQQEELARLFGRMAGARLLALPFVAALALWLAWVEPATWRRVALLVAVVGMVAFFVAEWVTFRRRGFTPSAFPRNLIIATVWRDGDHERHRRAREPVPLHRPAARDDSRASSCRGR